MRLSRELVRSSHAAGREHIEMKFVIVWIDMSIGENCRSKINWAQGKRGKDRKTWLNCNYIPKFICKYPNAPANGVSKTTRCHSITRMSFRDKNWLRRGSNKMRRWQEINLIFGAQVWLSTRGTCNVAELPYNDSLVLSTLAYSVPNCISDFFYKTIHIE